MIGAIFGDLVDARGEDVLLLVNGFGGTPLMELYLMYHAARNGAAARGLKVARSLVGNYVTSLDMAGCSITRDRARRGSRRCGMRRCTRRRCAGDGKTTGWAQSPSGEDCRKLKGSGGVMAPRSEWSRKASDILALNAFGAEGADGLDGEPSGPHREAKTELWRRFRAVLPRASGDRAGRGLIFMPPTGGVSRFYDNVRWSEHLPASSRRSSRQIGQLNTHSRYLHEGILAYAERSAATFPADLWNMYSPVTGSKANDLALRIPKRRPRQRVHRHRGRLSQQYGRRDRGVALLLQARRAAARVRIVPAPDPRLFLSDLGNGFWRAVRGAIVGYEADGIRLAG